MSLCKVTISRKTSFCFSNIVSPRTWCKRQKNHNKGELDLCKKDFGHRKRISKFSKTIFRNDFNQTKPNLAAKARMEEGLKTVVNVPCPRVSSFFKEWLKQNSLTDVFAQHNMLLPQTSKQRMYCGTKSEIQQDGINNFPLENFFLQFNVMLHI